MATRSSATIPLLLISSIGGTVAVVSHAFHLKKQFYPAVVYLSNSGISMMFIYYQISVLAFMATQLFKRIFFGRLRNSEREHLIEKSWFAITETCLAMTIFRDEFTAKFAAQFMLLLLIKVYHWLTQDRVEFMEQTPNLSRVFHLRMVSVSAILTLADAYMVLHAVNSITESGPSMQLLFGFEYVVLLTAIIATVIKYGMQLIDINSVDGWEEKAIYVFYIDLVLDFLKLAVYIMFFCVIMKFYGLPLHIIRDLFATFTSFAKRLHRLMQSRRATRNLETRYPTPTAEELAQTDNICVICRDEMVAGVEANSSHCKKLHCGHIFHTRCLRSWLHRQQICPTCRDDVLESDQAHANRAQVRAAAVNRPAVAPHQQPHQHQHQHQQPHQPQQPQQPQQQQQQPLAPPNHGQPAATPLPHPSTPVRQYQPATPQPLPVTPAVFPDHQGQAQQFVAPQPPPGMPPLPQTPGGLFSFPPMPGMMPGMTPGQSPFPHLPPLPQQMGMGGMGAMPGMPPPMFGTPNLGGIMGGAPAGFVPFNFSSRLSTPVEALTTWQLQELEGNERDKIISRIEFLRGFRSELDSMLARFGQYEQIAGDKSAAFTSSSKPGPSSSSFGGNRNHDSKRKMTETPLKMSAAASTSTLSTTSPSSSVVDSLVKLESLLESQQRNPKAKLQQQSPQEQEQEQEEAAKDKRKQVAASVSNDDEVAPSRETSATRSVVNRNRSREQDEVRMLRLRKLSSLTKNDDDEKQDGSETEESTKTK